VPLVEFDQAGTKNSTHSLEMINTWCCTLHWNTTRILFSFVI